jgi:ABC-type uncharacterized transport system permease subunit
MVPGYLQAKRGSHIVITTIMFNMLASALLVYLLVNIMGKPGSMSPETRGFAPAAHVPFMHDALAVFGFKAPTSPLNLSFVLALLCAVAVWVVIWRTRLGYAIRTVGANPTAAVYAGISIARITVIAMLMVEDKGAIAELDDIAAVKSYSLLSCGIGSLTQNMGGDAPGAEAACQRARDLGAKAGMPSMMTASASTIKNRIEKGYLGLLLSGTADQASAIIRTGRPIAKRP